MEHMAMEGAMRGGVTDRSLPAVRGSKTSLCNLNDGVNELNFLNLT
jgi:hypothetical protein